MALEARGDHARAAELYGLAHEVRIRVQGPEHPDTLEVAWRRAVLMGRREEPTSTSDCHLNLNLNLNQRCVLMGRHEEPAVDRVEESHGPVEDSEARVGESPALLLLRATATAQTKALGAEHPRTLRTLVSLGEVLVANGGPKLAAEVTTLWTRCEAAQSAVLDPTHPELMYTRELLGRVARNQTLAGRQAGGGIEGLKGLDDPATCKAAEAIYAFAHMNQCLERLDGHPWDGVLCLCSSDLRVARHAAELHKKLGGWLCFTGGMGTGPHSGANLLGWAEPEAVIFAREAVERCGVPKDEVLVEADARNTGENVSLSRALLASHGLACERVVLVQKPFMERRTWATVKRVWPEVDAVIQSPALSLDACVAGSGVPAEVLIAIMVGDMQRIRLYALPPREFQIAQPIPQDVWKAYETLVAAGFTMNVVPTEDLLEWAPSWNRYDERDGSVPSYGAGDAQQSLRD
jgi:uncharacterized SAM-binding protein YcdF (DUF218 family)